MRLQQGSVNSNLRGQIPGPLSGHACPCASPYLETPLLSPAAPLLMVGGVACYAARKFTSVAHPGEPRRYIRTEESDPDQAAAKEEKGRKKSDLTRPPSILARRSGSLPERSLSATGKGAAARNLALNPESPTPGPRDALAWLPIGDLRRLWLPAVLSSLKTFCTECGVGSLLQQSSEGQPRDGERRAATLKEVPSRSGRPRLPRGVGLLGPPRLL